MFAASHPHGKSMGIKFSDVSIIFAYCPVIKRGNEVFMVADTSDALARCVCFQTRVLHLNFTSTNLSYFVIVNKINYDGTCQASSPHLFKYTGRGCQPCMAGKLLLFCYQECLSDFRYRN